MLVDNVHDYQAAFSKWWVQEWKTVTFPEKVSRKRLCARIAPRKRLPSSYLLSQIAGLMQLGSSPVTG